MPWWWHSASGTPIRCGMPPASSIDAGGTEGGACWAVIRERWHQFIFGFYPQDLYWRPILAFGLLFVALAPVLYWNDRKGAILTGITGCADRAGRLGACRRPAASSWHRCISWSRCSRWPGSRQPADLVSPDADPALCRLLAAVGRVGLVAHCCDGGLWRSGPGVSALHRRLGVVMATALGSVAACLGGLCCRGLCHRLDALAIWLAGCAWARFWPLSARSRPHAAAPQGWASSSR